MHVKTMLVVALFISAIAVPLALAAPMQAYVNASSKGDLLRTQDRDQLRLRDNNCTCDGTQERTRLQDCTGDAVGNSTTNMEQYRYQYEYQYQNRNQAEQPADA